MKLERLHEYVLPVLATLGGMVFAVYCGRLTGQGQMGMLSTILGSAAVLTMLLLMRGAIWIWIPITWTLSGQILVLPLPFAARDLVVMSVFVCFLVLKALKVIRRKPEITGIDILLGLALFYLATVFVRNPVGFNALGSSKIGGRPYVNVAIACMAYWVLSRASVSMAVARYLPILISIGQATEGFLILISTKVPQIGAVVGSVYSGVSLDDNATNVADLQRNTGRVPYWGGIGQSLSYYLMVYFRPMTLINPFYILRCIGFGLALTMIGLSGYRSVMINTLVFFAISSYVRRGWSDVIRILVIGTPLLALILASQGTVINLPLSIQRTLSFLPGKWDYLAVTDAKASSQWRFEMWKEMLATDKYIDNKWFGDGFGFTRRQFDVMLALSKHSSDSDEQETAMITGGVHSGPISSIRYVGYVGLVVHLIILVVMAKMAWKLVHRARSTPFFPLALLIGIPIVWEPLNFVFIFGGYEGSLPTTLYWAGLLKMLANSMREAELKSVETPSKEFRKEPKHRRLEPALAGYPRLAAN